MKFPRYCWVVPDWREADFVSQLQRVRILYPALLAYVRILSEDLNSYKWENVMSTDLMECTNGDGSRVALTGVIRNGQRRYQLTVHCSPTQRDELPIDGIAYALIDEETIANMQRCVRDYKETYPV